MLINFHPKRNKIKNRITDIWVIRGKSTLNLHQKKQTFVLISAKNGIFNQ